MTAETKKPREGGRSEAFTYTRPRPNAHGFRRIRSQTLTLVGRPSVRPSAGPTPPPVTRAIGRRRLLTRCVPRP